jgi:hypothetical protein
MRNAKRPAIPAGLLSLVQLGLGETTRLNRWGRDRKYVVAFLSGGSPHQPLVEFVAADDYEDTRACVRLELFSVGGGERGAVDLLHHEFALHEGMDGAVI